MSLWFKNVQPGSDSQQLQTQKLKAEFILFTGRGAERGNSECAVTVSPRDGQSQTNPLFFLKELALPTTPRSCQLLDEMSEDRIYQPNSYRKTLFVSQRNARVHCSRKRH